MSYLLTPSQEKDISLYERKVFFLAQINGTLMLVNGTQIAFKKKNQVMENDYSMQYEDVMEMKVKDKKYAWGKQMKVRWVRPEKSSKVAQLGLKST